MSARYKVGVSVNAMRLRAWKRNPAPCDCGQRAVVYKSDGWVCARCLEMERVDREKALAQVRKASAAKKAARLSTVGAWELAYQCHAQYRRY